MKRLSLLITLCLTLFVHFPIEASEPSPESRTIPSLPRPHLDYGIHVAPHAGGGIDSVNALGMNWVKIYEPGQATAFPGKRILYRMDFAWPSNWDQFRMDVRNRTLELVGLGVAAIEVHNEPNLGLEWPRGPNAWEYTHMLRVSYTEIKAVAPGMIVVSGGLASTVTTGDGRAVNDLDFAREMFENGAGQYFDVFGYHPYGYNAPPEQAPSKDILNFRRTELIRDLMVEFDLGDKPIWLTEFGWLRSPSEDGVPCSAGDPDFREFVWMQLDGRTQADYIVRSFDYADRNWAWTGVMFLWNLNWSLLPLEALSTCNHMRWFSLLNMRGERTTAFNRVAAMPRRPIRYIPELTLVADQMTVEVGVTCPGVVKVGEFEITNTGYPGEFTTTIEPALSFSGPTVEVSPTIAEIGDVVTIFADTTGLEPRMYIIYINARATIAGQEVARNIRGYVIVSESYAACQ